MTLTASPVPRIVLDTNVCLDLFLFHDPASAPLMEALQEGRVQAVCRDDGREEWRRVLNYPQLPIDDTIRPGLSEAFDRLIHYLPAAELSAEDAARLPRCGDPDDQKFMELALATQARWLLSKDNELLKLDRRTHAAGLFRILLPQHWAGPAA